MGQSAAELRQEIAETRGEMSRDLDAIGDRVSPRRMAERRLGRTRRWVTTSRERVFGAAEDVRYRAGDQAHGVAGTVSETVGNAPDQLRAQTRGNPMVAGGVAFGLGFLASLLFEPTEQEEELVRRAEDQIEPIKEELGQMASEVGSTVADAGREAASHLKDDASGRAQSVGEVAREQSQQATAAARGTN